MNSFITAKATRYKEDWKDLKLQHQAQKQLIKHNHFIQLIECKITFVKLVTICMQEKNKLYTVNVGITSDVRSCVQVEIEYHAMNM
jgi:hypothetical protein